MKKTTKALYAATAGLALITSSGGGTLALWSDTAPLSATGSQIQTGDLRLDFADQSKNAYNQVTWTLYNASDVVITSGTWEQIGANVQIDAGYRLEGVAEITATLTGNTLVANLKRSQTLNSIDGHPTIATWLTSVKNGIEIAVTQNGTVIPADKALSTTGNYTVKIIVPFPSQNFPHNDGHEVWQAIMRLGQIDLELLQVVSDGAFGG
jgi:alternate signal-mediated exported protein